MSVKHVRQPTEALEDAIADLLWNSLKRATDHPGSRRQTAWGTKTRYGLAASILRVVDEQMPAATKGGEA